MSNKNYIISQGHCRHLGATIEKDGVNFAVWAPDVAEIDLLLFDAVDDDSPYVVHLSSTVFKSTYFWHVFVHNIGAGQIYAYRVTKTVDSPQAQSQAEEINKILIDPYGKEYSSLMITKDSYLKTRSLLLNMHLRVLSSMWTSTIGVLILFLTIHLRTPSSMRCM